MAQQFDPAKFSEFKLRVNVNTSIENAYRAWATSAGVGSWFLRATYTDQNGNIRSGDELAQEGDDYGLAFSFKPDMVICTGKVLKANGRDLFSFSFSKGCPVTISIYQEQDETIIQLIESHLPTDEETIRKHFIGDTKGWIFYLTNLKSVLEGGLDLRNKNAALKSVITQ
jgi:hypothetical protein